jgi:hypothetical protein
MIRDIEQREVERIAKQYADRGYTVLVEPKAADGLPEELRVIAPDLVASRGDENIIIEVKTKGVNESRDRLIKLAKIVERYPNWRFYVHLFDPEEEAGRQSPQKATLVESLRSAKNLFDQGHRVASLLLLWSAFEAAGEAALRNEGVEVSAGWEHGSLEMGLTFHGLLEDEDYRRLSNIRNIRNLAAHGKVDLSVDDNDFDFLLNISERLIANS